MKRIAIVVAAVLAVFVGSARAEDAKALFALKCAACHGATGKGDTAMGKKLAAKDLTTLKASEQEISTTISNGKGKMTPYKDKLSADQIQALTKYVKGGLK